MSNDEIKGMCIGLCFAWCICVVLVFAGGIKAASGYQRLAVEAGHAHYDQLTREFRWNDPCGPRPERGGR